MTADAGDFAYPDDSWLWNQIDARLGPGSPARQRSVRARRDLRIRPGQRRLVIGPRPNQRLRIQCWCGNRYGQLPAARVRAGQTFSCNPNCTPDSALTRRPRGGRKKQTAA